MEKFYCLNHYLRNNFSELYDPNILPLIRNEMKITFIATKKTRISGFISTIENSDASVISNERRLDFNQNKVKYEIALHNKSDTKIIRIDMLEIDSFLKKFIAAYRLDNTYRIFVLYKKFKSNKLKRCKLIDYCVDSVSSFVMNDYDITDSLDGDIDYYVNQEIVAYGKNDEVKKNLYIIRILNKKKTISIDISYRNTLFEKHFQLGQMYTSYIFFVLDKPYIVLLGTSNKFQVRFIDYMIIYEIIDKKNEETNEYSSHMLNVLGNSTLKLRNKIKLPSKLERTSNDSVDIIYKEGHLWIRSIFDDTSDIILIIYDVINNLITSFSTNSIDELVWPIGDIADIEIIDKSKVVQLEFHNTDSPYLLKVK